MDQIQALPAIRRAHKARPLSRRARVFPLQTSPEGVGGREEHLQMDRPQGSCDPSALCFPGFISSKGGAHSTPRTRLDARRWARKRQKGMLLEPHPQQLHLVWGF